MYSHVFSLIIVCLMHIIADLSTETSQTSTGFLVFTAFLSIAGSSPLLSLLGIRLLMNMRVAAERGLNQGTNCPQAGLGRSSGGRETESEATSEMDFMDLNIEEDEEICV